MKLGPFYIGVLAALATAPAVAQQTNSHGMKMMTPRLMLPSMDAARGRALFAQKGCVVCHSVNGVGGEDAPSLDADTMDEVMNPFDFAARMGRSAAAMVAMQEDELGAQIELTGQDLADITAFVHDPHEQAIFSAQDIPHEDE